MALTVIGWIAFAMAIPFSGCVTVDGHRFAYQQTCGPTPPTAWRLECTYVALAASTACLIPALVLLVRGHKAGTVVALLLAIVSIGASLVGWLLPLLSAAIGC